MHFKAFDADAFPQEPDKRLSAEHSLQHAPQPVRFTQTLPAEQADYYLKLGNRYYHHYLSHLSDSDLNSAIDHYRRALEAKPDMPEGYVRLASALWEKGDIDLQTALDYCQFAIGLNRKNAEPYLFMGYFFKRNQHLDKAIESFQQAICKAPLSLPKARIALGLTRIQQAKSQTRAKEKTGLLVGGVAQFILGCCCLPFDKQATTMLWEALVTDTQVYGYLFAGSLAETLGIKQLSVTLYEQASKQFPAEAVFYSRLAALHQKIGRLEESAYFYQQAKLLQQEALPESVQPSLSLPGEVFSDAPFVQDAQDGETAFEAFSQGANPLPQEANGQSFDDLYQLAYDTAQQNDFIRALYYLKNLNGREPHNPYVLSNMGYVLFKLEDIDGAIDTYRTAIRYGKDPNWTATVAQTLATIYAESRQDVPSALEMSELSHRLNPKNPASLQSLADLTFQQGQMEESLAYYRDLITLEPENADHYCYIGYILWQMNHNEEAIDAYRRAIQLDPDHAIAHNNLGVIYLDDQQDPAAAYPLFEKAQQLNQSYALACFNQARALEQMGRVTDAAKAYSQALELNSQSPEVEDAEIVERLDRLFSVEP